MIYLALGTNIEPRRDFLRIAKTQLQEAGEEILACSPVYENPALLPQNANNEWQKNFLNQVIAINSTKTPEQLLVTIKKVEFNLGRNLNLKWGPRPIDIDILLFHNEEILTPTLTIPHISLKERNFFLKPLLDVAHILQDKKTLSSYRPFYQKHRLPQWMYIFNMTPDSFSSPAFDENRMNDVKAALDAGAHIIDVGAESTRPKAKPLTANEEWQRLQPYLARVKTLCQQYEAKLSVDTYHPQTMTAAIEQGADIINDVGGLSQPKSLEIFLRSNVEWVAMHNLGLPADPKNILPGDKPAIAYIQQWLAGLDSKIPQEQKHRLIIDPGIGFGKNAEQSRNILKHWQSLSGYRIVIGHSRKSFLTGITDKEFKDRDIETVALSLRLGEEGVDILRIHNMEMHKRAYMSYLA
jgi:2-amino-4-hydroxy-6-hydroxymethyldihydropteridine diphosphokinase / dihydropteroate synthase